MMTKGERAMTSFRRLFSLTVLLTVGLVAGVLINSRWMARASSGERSPSSNTTLPQTSKFEYAVITNLLTTSSSGKMVATAWIRYFRSTGSDLLGVNRSVSATVDYPKDEAAIRRWLATTNSEEGVNLSSVNLTAEMVKRELAEQVRREALAKAFAKLGDDGWELVGSDSRAANLFAVDPMLSQASSGNSSPVMIYFKKHTP
jgi:hypothetical protein